MRNRVYEKISDCGEESLWMKRHGPDPLNTVLVSIYSDNFHISGRSPLAIQDHINIREEFGFSDEQNFELTDVIGVEREVVRLPDGTKGLFIHQTQYSNHAVASFEKKFYKGQELPAIATPMATGEEIEEEAVPEKIPEISAAQASSLAGELNWVARGTRYDLCLPGKRVAQRLRDWQRPDAAMVFRTFKYWKGTRDHGILMTASERDIAHWVIEIEVDSDLGNDIFSARSTSSHWGLIAGPQTFCPMTWSSKGNTATGRNTAEVEAIAIDRGTFLHALPLAATLERVLGRTVRVIVRSDNTAAIAAGLKGFSRKLAYLRKYKGRACRLSGRYSSDTRSTRRSMTSRPMSCRRSTPSRTGATWERNLWMQFATGL